MTFEITATDSVTPARTGRLKLAHGEIVTPVFMPCATNGSVRSIASRELEPLGTQMVLANTYHLHLRPTSELIAQTYGSLHRFMGWDRPILTDSGGYQVFSLGRATQPGRPRTVRIKPDGVEFRSHLDGSRHFFTPARVIEIQTNLGSDIMMPLDVCPDGNADRAVIKQATELTLAWARQSLENKKLRPACADQALFAIVQGGPFSALRRRAARQCVAMGFDGYAIGGVANGGESKAMMDVAIEASVAELPGSSPRYLMGVGEPTDVIGAVARGVDMFDCVLPTRLGRHGVAWVGSEIDGFETVRIAQSRWRTDTNVLMDGCDCPACAQGVSRGYLHHLFAAGEIVGLRFLSSHNLRFIHRLFETIRARIADQTFGTHFGRWCG